MSFRHRTPGEMSRLSLDCVGMGIAREDKTTDNDNRALTTTTASLTTTTAALTTTTAGLRLADNESDCQAGGSSAAWISPSAPDNGLASCWDERE